MSLKVAHHDQPATPLVELKVVPLATRTTLFILILVPFSFFIITSTGSSLGVGLTIGIVIDLVIDMLRLARNKDEFIKTFLQQFQRPFSDVEVLMVAAGSVFWLLLLFLFAVK